MSPTRTCCLFALLAAAHGGLAATVRYDFTKPDVVAGWQPQHDVSAVSATANGMEIAISGPDPYIGGPPHDYDAKSPLWVHLRLKSPSGGMGQVFWSTPGKGPNETDSVRFPVAAGDWADVRVPMPPLAKATRLRFDPPGDHGTVTVALLETSERQAWKEPVWPVPPASFETTFGGNRPGNVLINLGSKLGAFTVSVDGTPMAIGNARPLIGYVIGGRSRWLDVNKVGRASVMASGGFAVQTTRARDSDGGEWKIEQAFNPFADYVDVATTVSCSRDRDILYLPMLTLLPGAGSFGPHKNQALFAGLEYLDGDEPSSSEKDIIGPGANRRVPDTAKLTQPLMVVQHNGRYVGLIWKPSPRFCAVFDSPDRTFKSGGHLMGVMFPGSDGSNREEGSLLPYAPVTVKAGEKVTLEAKIIGGKGDSVVPAICRYVEMNPAPPPPATGLPWERYAALASAGWLDSAIRKDGLYAHAYPGSFLPQPAADAAAWMAYLAGQMTDTVLAARLRTASKEALEAVPSGEMNYAGVGHVRYPVPSLAYGHALESVRPALRDGRDALNRFRPGGSVLYVKRPETPDLGRTHFSHEANGLTADAVVQVLRAAAYTGDPALKREGLRVLDAMAKFANTAPRGAQTWEVPLHTPDILASANLVNAYVLGYELTRDERYLEQARYWAWTGVPFAYLVPPVERPVGLYGTIAVYGATQWVAPNWMGLPVQWCGLVYADALYSLARYDSSGPWKRLSDGIAASGIQQTFPVGEDPKRQGLLPDSFNLRGQMRNDPGINPATLLPSAVRLYGREPIFSSKVFANGVIVHAPGRIEAAEESAHRLALRLYPWPKAACQVLLVGLKKAPASIRVNGRLIPGMYDSELGALAVDVVGNARIEVEGL